MKLLVPVDHTALKMNQSFIIGLVILAFILNLPWLAGFVSLVMLVGSLGLKRPGFGIVYTSLLKPAGLLKPDVLQDNREPHVFAQGMGGVVLAIATLLLYLGVSTLGWALAWFVVALAALNLFAGFCAGCAIYYWLHRLNIPGFIKDPPEGTFPGLKPRRIR